jgi:hypothetical protein
MLRDWLRRLRRQPAKVTQVVLYTRVGCHLCDAAQDVLTTASRRFSLAVSVVDVDTKPDLVARFGLEVPVVEIAGRVRFRGRINHMLLERLLQKEG